MEKHLQQLEKHCRVCGRRLHKAKGRTQPIYQCTSFASDLHTSFGLDVSEDDGDIFPAHFCTPCYITMVRAVKAKEKGTPYFPTIKPFIWTRHTTLHCPVRNTLSDRDSITVDTHRLATTLTVSAKEGGRIGKWDTGRQEGESRKEVTLHLQAIAPDSLLPTEDTNPQYQGSLAENMCCPICTVAQKGHPFPTLVISKLDLAHFQPCPFPTLPISNRAHFQSLNPWPCPRLIEI